MSSPNDPDFQTWTHANLAKIAAELHQQNKLLHAAWEQTRLDLKDAIKIMRAHLSAGVYNVQNLTKETHEHEQPNPGGDGPRGGQQP